MASSSELTVKLPSIDSLKVTAGEAEAVKGERAEIAVDSQKLNRASTFMSRLQLGSLQRQRRPGDVWVGGVNRQPRPLGLVPDRRGKLDILQELRRLLPPLTNYTSPPIRVPHASDGRVKQDQPPVTADSKVEVISASVKTAPDTQGQSTDTVLKFPQTHLSEAPPPSSLLGVNDGPIPYRYTHGGHGTQVCKDEPDCDYMEAFDLHKYYTVSQPHPLPHPQAQHTAETWSGQLQPARSKRSARLGRCHFVFSGPQFLRFSEQSQLWDRTLSDDRRLPLPLEPCERCRERGGRCARCKALRVGGGYIILDGESLPEDALRKKFGRRYGLAGGQTMRDGRERRGKRRRQLSGDGSGSGVGSGVGGDGCDDGGDRGQKSAQGGRSGVGVEDGRGSGLGSGDGALSSRSGRGQLSGVGRGERSGGHGSDGGVSHVRGDESRRKTGGGGVSADADLSGGGRRRGEGGGASDGREGYDMDESGRTSSRGMIRSTGSRPGSRLGSRPPSSLRRGGLDRSGRDRRGVDLEGGRGRGRGRRDGEEGSGSDGSGDEGRGRRRRKKDTSDSERGDGTTTGHDGDDLDRSKFKFKSTRDDEDARPTSGYYGDLMRFKRKKDNVKAIHATLQELQGIDPLDYLARYCIIDQSKLPHYQHCYDNVDRDEDDEIDIAELDFALKAVNYDLISDSEMSYVHSVLELTGRYKLNFRLFSLIAALSEKVVALEDMVKRLINKMDFEALEVKMKKCKELFYLLADAESSMSQEGGVVTTGSLAVELQAGGLTSEHVEFVVDRLNHEGKGLVEFLDYLTYVPLFVEIHDSIYGNPLDFTRTK